MPSLSLLRSPRTRARAGYGGFTVPINPFFSPAILTWMQKYGAVLAVANIRGGGEFGEEWHLAGTRERKARPFRAVLCALETNGAS